MAFPCRTSVIGHTGSIHHACLPEDRASNTWTEFDWYDLHWTKFIWQYVLIWYIMFPRGQTRKIESTYLWNNCNLANAISQETLLHAHLHERVLLPRLDLSMKRRDQVLNCTSHCTVSDKLRGKMWLISLLVNSIVNKASTSKTPFTNVV